MKNNEVIQRLNELINDQDENIQYGDESEIKWRKKCKTALNVAIEIIEKRAN